MLFSEHPPIYAVCMTIWGGRTEQLDIIAGFLPSHWLYQWFSSAENVCRYIVEFVKVAFFHLCRSVYNVDELIESLSDCDFGCYIGSQFFGCIIYADDIILLSHFRKGTTVRV